MFYYLTQLCLKYDTGHFEIFGGYERHFCGSQPCCDLKIFSFQSWPYLVPNMCAGGGGDVIGVTEFFGAGWSGCRAVFELSCVFSGRR